MKQIRKGFVLGIITSFAINLASCGDTSSSALSTSSEESNQPSVPDSSISVASHSEQSDEEKKSDSVESSNLIESQNDESSVSDTDSTSGSFEPETEEHYTRVDSEGRENPDGKYLLFGSYPQRHVRDETIISALDEIETVNSSGYLEYDGEQYAKVNAKTYNHSTEYRFMDGTSVVEGHDYYFKVMPITWKILEIKADGTALLLCDKLLDSRPFQSEYIRKEVDEKGYYYNTTPGVPERTLACNYQYSEIRSWIKGSFFERAFTQEEKGIVKTTLVDNSLSSTCDTTNPNTCDDTNEKVFLLSFQEATLDAYEFKTFEGWVDARLKSGSDYALARGLMVNNDKTTCWWLRTPDPVFYGLKVKCFRVEGNYGVTTIHETYCDNIGVAPALNLTL